MLLFEGRQSSNFIALVFLTLDCDEPPEGPEIWKKVFLCGTELEQMSQVYDIQWDFSHLDECLQAGNLSLVSKAKAQGGEQDVPKKVYLFGCTEPQMFPLDENRTTVIHIPVIVAVQTAVELPDKLGLNSVQMATEQIVDMARFKMSWAPFEVPRSELAAGGAHPELDSAPADGARGGIGSGVRGQPEKPTPAKRRRTQRKGRDAQRVWILQCTQRKGTGTLKNLAEERRRSFDYCMPYVLLPQNAVEDAPDTTVDIMCDLPDRSAPLVFEYDWELDDIDDMVDEKKRDEELTDAQGDALRSAIASAVSSTKKQRKAERQARALAIQSLGEEKLAALRDILIYKFYPKNQKCQAMKSKYVNRYFGQAHLVV